MNEQLAAVPKLDLVKLAIEKGAAIDVIERVAALVKDQAAIAAKEEWCVAVAGFKRDCPPILKTNAVLDKHKNTIYKFASYDDIKAVTTPLERKYGIVTGFSFENTAAGNLKATLKVTVGSHTEEFHGGVPVPKSGAGGINETQLMGQAHTYVKRYLYLAAFDLLVAGEDSDAVGLIDTITPAQIGKVNDAIDECRKAGNWDEETSFKHMLAKYEIENLADLPRERVLHLMADLDSQRAGRKAVRK